MGKMKEIAILLDEWSDEHPEDFDYLETLSIERFEKEPIVIELAKHLGISIDFLSYNFMHDVE